MTTVNATIASPRLLLIGGGTVRQIAEILGQFGLSRPLIVSDPIMVSTGLIQRALEPLTAAGIAVRVFSDTVSDPTDTVIEAGVAQIRASDGYDCLIGFGGGSPIDTAKAMAILAAGGGKMRDYKAPVAADNGALPIIAIPTTAGTGSECTRFTVITDTERDEKMLIAGLGALPLAAIVDYELTYSVPPRTTADTGVDSFTHALEAYVSKRANPFSDALALSAMELIGKHIRAAYAEPRQRRGARGHDARRNAGGSGVLQQLGGAGAWHVAADWRAFPCAARAVQCHASAGDHPLVGAGGRGALRRSRPACRLRGRQRRRRRGGGQAGHRIGRAEQRVVGADPGRLRHQGGRLERKDGADGGAGAGVRQPGKQSARA